MIPTRCVELESRLDAGAVESLSPELLDHVRDCERCTRALAVARSLDVFLATALPARTPDHFTDAVLARLDAVPAPARTPLSAGWRDPMPFAVRIAMEPVVMLALTLAALCVFLAPSASGLATRLVALGGVAAPLVAPRGAAWVSAVGFAPLAGIAAYGLFAWSRQLGAGHAVRNPRVTASRP